MQRSFLFTYQGSVPELHFKCVLKIGFLGKKQGDPEFLEVQTENFLVRIFVRNHMIQLYKNYMAVHFFLHLLKT